MVFQLGNEKKIVLLAISNTFNWLNQSKWHRHESPSPVSRTTCRVWYHIDFWKFRKHNSYGPPCRIHIVHITDHKWAHTPHCPHMRCVCHVFETCIIYCLFIVMFVWFIVRFMYPLVSPAPRTRRTCKGHRHHGRQLHSQWHCADKNVSGPKGPETNRGQQRPAANSTVRGVSLYVTGAGVGWHCFLQFVFPITSCQTTILKLKWEIGHKYTQFNLNFN